VYINPERKFAFVEFNRCALCLDRGCLTETQRLTAAALCSIELANSIMTLDGLMFKGQPVKVRRPNDYNPLLLPLELREKVSSRQ